MQKLKLIAALLLALICIILVLQNTETVETKVLFATVSMPRAVLLFITALAGFAVGLLVSLGWFRRKKGP